MLKYTRKKRLEKHSLIVFFLLLLVLMSLCSDLGFGYGGHDQHSQRLDWKPSEVCPLPRCPTVTRCWHGQPWGTDPHPDCWRIPALQPPVSSLCVYSPSPAVSLLNMRLANLYYFNSTCKSYLYTSCSTNTMFLINIDIFILRYLLLANLMEFVSMY